MANKAIWKGSINFGDINLPIKLHTAVREERIQFHLLHKRDKVKLHQKMICAYDREPVPAAEQVKGFEVEGGKYIIVDQADLEQADPKSSRLVEVHDFAKTAEIDPLYFEHVYYLEPDAGGKGYRALAEAMERLGVSGICTWVMRKRPYLGALQSRGNVLRLTTLRYADEVIAASSLELKALSLTEKELKIGIELISQLTVPFEPQKFVNEHQKKLQLLIDKKVRGEKITILRPRKLKPTSSDRLLQALEASLKKVA
ncbi:MAG: Ku protein [Nitrospirae bacterium]|nr:Ku protein [Nitrospirota bacterium]